MEELKRLKNLKRQEIQDKISRIREAAGVAEGLEMDSLGLDLEGYYDPIAHDAKMAAVFNDSFYGDAQTDAYRKPSWNEDIDISDIVSINGQKPEEAYAPGGDAYDPTEPGRTGKKSKAERKKDKKTKKTGKGKEKFSELDKDDLGEEVQENGASSFDPEEVDAIVDPEERKRIVDHFMDEYYKLDYEDMVCASDQEAH